MVKMVPVDKKGEICVLNLVTNFTILDIQSASTSSHI